MPGVSGSGPTPCLAAQLCGVSAKLNHSNSMPAIASKPSFSARFEHALQGLARADRVGRAVGVDELAEEERHAVVPGHVARGVEVDARQRVGKAVLPAGDLGVVVALVVRVPAEHHVAEAEAALGVRLGGAEELVDVQVLAAQDAVDVAARDLDLAGVGLAHRGERRVFFGGGHGECPSCRSTAPGRRRECPSRAACRPPRSRPGASRCGRWRRCSRRGRSRSASACPGRG